MDTVDAFTEYVEALLEGQKEVRERLFETVDSRKDALSRALDDAEFTEISDDEGVLESNKPAFKKMFGTRSIEFKKEDGDWKVCSPSGLAYHLVSGTTMVTLYGGLAFLD